jgi:hypothetical protein
VIIFSPSCSPIGTVFSPSCSQIGTVSFHRHVVKLERLRHCKENILGGDTEEVQASHPVGLLPRHAPKREKRPEGEAFSARNQVDFTYFTHFTRFSYAFPAFHAFHTVPAFPAFPAFHSQIICFNPPLIAPFCSLDLLFQNASFSLPLHPLSPCMGEDNTHVEPWPLQSPFSCSGSWGILNPRCEQTNSSLAPTSFSTLMTNVLTELEGSCPAVRN